jgi:predicted transcriptional regulator of viral defense system/very-short-patch-repair endonuclease
VRDEHWRQIVDTAARQDGLINSAQVNLTGASPNAIDLAVAAGRLIRVRKGVSLVAGVPTTPRQPIRAVTMVSRTAVVSHRSAAWLHGLMMRPWSTIEITVPSSSNVDLHGVTAHQARVARKDRMSIDGIPVTTPARTLVDLTGHLADDWVQRLVHEAVMRRLCGYEDVAEVLKRVGGRGHPGTATLRAVLADAVGSTPLEAKWHRILCEAGLKPPARQHQVVIGERVFLLDYAWPDHRVALEIDGFVAHRTSDSFDRDHAKLLALRAAGWEVLCVTNRTPPAAAIAFLRRFIPVFHKTPSCGNPCG